MTNRNKGKGNLSMKYKAHARARKEKILKGIKEECGLCEDKKCYLYSLHRNLEDSDFNGKIMDVIPTDYIELHESKIAIRDQLTKEVVLVVSFSTFEDLEKNNEYEDFEKIMVN